MVDETASSAAALATCPWCSAPVPSADATVCPSCSATLVSEGELQLPGVTALDAEAIVRAAREIRAPRRRSRLLSWLSGDDDEDEPEGSAPPGSIEPPSADVRREMLRLQLAAEVANLQAEVDALEADAGHLPGADDEGHARAEPEAARATEAPVDAKAPAVDGPGEGQPSA